MTIYTEEALYALSLSDLIELCQERQVTPLSSNPRWKKTYVPALLEAQAQAEVPSLSEGVEAPSAAEPDSEASAEPEEVTFLLPPCPWTAEELLEEESSLPEPGEEETVLAPTSLAYPIILFLVVGWVVLQTIIAAVSVFVFALRWLARRADASATQYLEAFRAPASDVSLVVP